MRQRLRALFPTGVAVGHLAEPAQATPLHPREEPAIARARGKRREDFVAGRHCARAALTELGVPRAVLEKRADGCVAWPPGTTGSITHCTGFYAAAVAPLALCGSLGLDAEQSGRVTASLVRAVTTEDERARLATLPRDEVGPFLDLVFSAKEAFYKAQFPRSGGAWIGFADVSLVEVGAGDFRLRLERSIEGLAAAGAGFRGRWFHTGTHVVTGLWFEA